MTSSRLKKLLLPLCLLAVTIFVLFGLLLWRTGWLRSHFSTRQIITVDGNELYVDKKLDLNPFTEEDFSREEGRAVCHAMPYRTGVDVSAHQGEVDWQAVAEDGISFAMLRCGFRGYGEQGDLNADKQFSDNLQNAADAGLDLGVYFFSQAVSVEEAVEEAEFVLDSVKDADLTLPIAYDWEFIRDAGPEGARTDEVDGETVTACALAFCETIREAGYDAMVYCNSETGYFSYDIAQLQEEALPIWYASFHSDYPNYFYHMDWWQYTDTGTVAGIDHDVDLTIWPIEQDPADSAGDSSASTSFS